MIIDRFEAIYVQPASRAKENEASGDSATSQDTRKASASGKATLDFWSDDV